ncbi:MAG: sterol desaturase [Ferruginibacter sp.]|nr:sterol desaturase [Ferruginibacter sp.]
MTHPAYLAFAVPLFLFFMGLEFVYARKKGKHFFRFAESIANINVGIAERLMDIFTMLPFFYFFEYIHANFSLFDIKATPFSWVLLFLATDLVWYWYHRLAHEVNIFWAAHIVHHQSEDFNYTTSARITVFQAAIRCLFWGVLPFIGFPAPMISVLLLIHGLYPFFIHTQTIGKLGWLEYFLVTPSHHRVHHSSNPQYLDKNYGDVLIIWDKLFGTFTEENEQPVYGLTKPLKSHSFLWQHFHYPLELWVAMKKTSGIRNKLAILFGRPDTVNPSIRVRLEKYFLRNQPRLQPSAIHRKYINLQTAVSLILLFLAIFYYPELTRTQVAFTSLFIFVSLVNTGAILEQRSWILYLEYFRLIILLCWVWLYYPTIIVSVSITCISVIGLLFFRPMEKRYKSLLYQHAGD